MREQECSHHLHVLFSEQNRRFSNPLTMSKVYTEKTTLNWTNSKPEINCSKTEHEKILLNEWNLDEVRSFRL